MSMAAPPYYTAGMVRSLPADGNRYETVHGELLVTPAPQPLHQRIAFRLARTLAAYAEPLGVGEVITSPADISWEDDVLVQPDIFVVPLAEARTLDWARMKTLLTTFPIVEREQLVWHPDGAPDALHVPLAKLFRPL